MEKTEFKTFGDVTDYFPYFCTAIIHDVKQLSRFDAALTHREQMESIGTRVVGWLPPENPSVLNLYELRASVLLENGLPVTNKDSGPIFINHYYDSDKEDLEDFSQGDIVTVLFKKSKNPKSKKILYPEYIYNHETTMLVKCARDLTSQSFASVYSGGVDIPFEDQKNTERAVDAVVFLRSNGKIAKQGNQSRPINDNIVNYRHSIPKKGLKTGSVVFFIFVLCVGLYLLAILYAGNLI